MSTPSERKYIGEKLMPEIRQRFELWAKEYQQERDLGKLGEFANLYRKARKLKTLVWDETGPVQPNGWRETERIIVMEVAAHALLMLTDLDKESGDFEAWLAAGELTDEDEDEEDLTTQGRSANRSSLRDRRKLASRAPGGVGRRSSSGYTKVD